MSGILSTPPKWHESSATIDRGNAGVSPVDSSVRARPAPSILRPGRMINVLDRAGIETDGYGEGGLTDMNMSEPASAALAPLSRPLSYRSPKSSLHDTLESRSTPSLHSRSVNIKCNSIERMPDTTASFVKDGTTKGTGGSKKHSRRSRKAGRQEGHVADIPRGLEIKLSSLDRRRLSKERKELWLEAHRAPGKEQHHKLEHKQTQEQKASTRNSSINSSNDSAAFSSSKQGQREAQKHEHKQLPMQNQEAKALMKNGHKDSMSAAAAASPGAVATGSTEAASTSSSSSSSSSFSSSSSSSVRRHSHAREGDSRRLLHPLSAGDKADIASLIHAYAHALDGGDPDGFAGLFHACDGELEIMKTGERARGRDSLRAYCRAQQRLQAGQATQRWEGNVLVTGAGGKAQSLSNWQLIQRGVCVGTGRHEDFFERRRIITDHVAHAHAHAHTHAHTPAGMGMLTPAANAANTANGNGCSCGSGGGSGGGSSSDNGSGSASGSAPVEGGGVASNSSAAIREDKVWLFTRRKVTVTWSKQGGVEQGQELYTHSAVKSHLRQLLPSGTVKSTNTN